MSGAWSALRESLQRGGRIRDNSEACRPMSQLTVGGSWSRVRTCQLAGWGVNRCRLVRPDERAGGNCCGGCVADAMHRTHHVGAAVGACCDVACNRNRVASEPSLTPILRDCIRLCPPPPIAPLRTGRSAASAHCWRHHAAKFNRVRIRPPGHPRRGEALAVPESVGILAGCGCDFDYSQAIHLGSFAREKWSWPNCLPMMR